MISLEYAVDSEQNDDIDLVDLCSVAEIFVLRNHKNPVLNGLKTQLCFNNFIRMCLEHFEVLHFVLKQNIYNWLKSTEACLIVLEAQNSVLEPMQGL